ncbi:metallopeptidase [Candidatus Roizmanbacteria bacterium CG10_big_fil_rev_8_21_14_0_10_39_6]|uniref:Metallopeptidase n=1 Tax=Candidatus Roizmanbacteria bacterium CG10_big_fil_rev_8_21_14_0_10_39_6 TaxID=1974853 RepID=A0A2M8KSY6_9BACT|nr:MAG: metallopeptidase [Candidatus Roizmanbacteria bacterium CG10_big_fil_rev_8_21_14_0_10_39_6]
MHYTLAPEIKKTIVYLVQKLAMNYISVDQIYCIRSTDSKTRAIARIWGMPKLFNEVVGIKPSYIIEVISERFDRQSDEEQIKTLIHELMHIPKTFSGSLLSHRGRYHRINDTEVKKLLIKLKMSSR